MKYLLGIDCGGTMIKAGIYDVQGNEIAIAKQKLAVLIPAEGMNERHIGQMKKANMRVIAEAIKRAGVDAKYILGVSVAGQGNGMYQFDGDGNPTYNGILSGDIRANAYIKKWNADGTLDRILPKTKQILWAGQTTALIAWFADHNKSVLEKTKVITTCKDYIRYLLTGVFCMELSEGSGLSAMNLDTRKLDPEIFAAMGIEAYMDKFPSQIFRSTDICGYVTEEAAALTGLCAGTPVMGGLFDISACAISSGVIDESILFIIIGTWGINEYIAKQPVVSKDMFMSTFYCIDGYYLMDEGSATSASNLDWFIERFMQTGETEGDANIYREVNELVASIPYNDSCLLFFPFLYGTNANIDAKAAFIGLSARHTKAHMLRAIFEGVVFCHMAHIEKLYKFREKPALVRISGGGTQSELWVQMFADVLGLPVETSAAKELGAMGAAMCAGVGAREFKDMAEAAGVFVKTAKAYQPDMEKHAYYQKKYKVYKSFIAAMDGAWQQMAALSDNE